jgi:hypothetical protein
MVWLTDTGPTPSRSTETSIMHRPATRPFIGGRPITQTEPTTFTYAPARPFSFAGSRLNSEATRSTTVKVPVQTPTPLWTVAVYEPGLEHVPQPSPQAVPSPHSSVDDIVDASLALQEGVVEAGRHASSLAAAEVLEVVAQRLRRGEILLLPGASTKGDTAVVSAVLAALLGGRR